MIATSTTTAETVRAATTSMIDATAASPPRPTSLHGTLHTAATLAAIAAHTATAAMTAAPAKITTPTDRRHSDARDDHHDSGSERSFDGYDATHTHLCTLDSQIRGCKCTTFAAQAVPVLDRVGLAWRRQHPIRGCDRRLAWAGSAGVDTLLSVGRLEIGCASINNGDNPPSWSPCPVLAGSVGGSKLPGAPATRAAWHSGTHACAQHLPTYSAVDWEVAPTGAVHVKR